MLITVISKDREVSLEEETRAVDVWLQPGLGEGVDIVVGSQTRAVDVVDFTVQTTNVLVI